MLLKVSVFLPQMLSYNRANRAVAILCNHQRAIPKTHDKSMANLQEKIEAKREQQVWQSGVTFTDHFRIAI